MSSRSRSTLFSIEQLAAIFIFAICAAVCANIFVSSYIMAADSRDMRGAIRAVQNGAECCKASGGDAGKTAALLGGTVSGTGQVSSAVVYYDSGWQVCEEADAAYLLSILRFEADEGNAPFMVELSVARITGEEMIALTVAARRSAG